MHLNSGGVYRSTCIIKVSAASFTHWQVNRLMRHSLSKIWAKKAWKNDYNKKIHFMIGIRLTPEWTTQVCTISHNTEMILWRPSTHPGYYTEQLHFTSCDVTYWIISTNNKTYKVKSLAPDNTRKSNAAFSWTTVQETDVLMRWGQTVSMHRAVVVHLKSYITTTLN